MEEEEEEETSNVNREQSTMRSAVHDEKVEVDKSDVMIVS